MDGFFATENIIETNHSLDLLIGVVLIVYRFCFENKNSLWENIVSLKKKNKIKYIYFLLIFFLIYFEFRIFFITIFFFLIVTLRARLAVIFKSVSALKNTFKCFWDENKVFGKF